MFLIWPRIRVCVMFMILFWMLNCVLLLLFHVLLVIVVFVVSMVAFCVFGACLFGAWPRGRKISGGVDLVGEVYMVLVVVVFEDTCCCYVCVDCGELLEPRVAKFVVGRELADWGKDEEGVVLLLSLLLLLCTCCYGC